jgi:hypothetical protein
MFRCLFAALLSIVTDNVYIVIVGRVDRLIIEGSGIEYSSTVSNASGSLDRRRRIYPRGQSHHSHRHRDGACSQWLVESYHVTLRYEHPETGEIRTVQVPISNADEISQDTYRSIATQCGARDFGKWCDWIKKNG